MTSPLHARNLILIAALIVTVSGAPLAMRAPIARADQLRTVYFSALDGKGAPVDDLTVADVTVKEGGKERAIGTLEQATVPMHIAIVIDDAGTGVFQAAVAQFIQATFGKAQFALSLMSPQPMKVLDYSNDFEALRAAVGKLGQRGRIQSGGGEQIIEAVSDTAKELRRREARRPVIVVLTNGGETALSDRADPTLTELRNSRASLHVIHTAGLQLGRVLGDGPRESGGTIDQVAEGVLIGQVLSKVANTLLHQYALTYTLPEGVKPNERLQIATSRKAIKLVAPTRIPDR